MESVYDLFTRGTRLLEDGDFHAATVPLTRARDLEPDKTSVREALGRALFRSQRYEDAAREVSAVDERAPTTDFALLCLGRSLQLLRRHRGAGHPLALAAHLRPERRDDRRYRGEARARAAWLTRAGSRCDARGASRGIVSARGAQIQGSGGWERVAAAVAGDAPVSAR